MDTHISSHTREPFHHPLSMVHKTTKSNKSIQKIFPFLPKSIFVIFNSSGQVPIGPIRDKLINCSLSMSCSSLNSRSPSSPPSSLSSFILCYYSISLGIRHTRITIHQCNNIVGVILIIGRYYSQTYRPHQVSSLNTGHRQFIVIFRINVVDRQQWDTYYYSCILIIHALILQLCKLEQNRKSHKYVIITIPV